MPPATTARLIRAPAPVHAHVIHDPPPMHLHCVTVAVHLYLVTVPFIRTNYSALAIIDAASVLVSTYCHLPPLARPYLRHRHPPHHPLSTHAHVLPLQTGKELGNLPGQLQKDWETTRASSQRLNKAAAAGSPTPIEPPCYSLRPLVWTHRGHLGVNGDVPGGSVSMQSRLARRVFVDIIDRNFITDFTYVLKFLHDSDLNFQYYILLNLRVP
eukprot:SAG11_NODE_851_length_6875_cov_8.193034_1_plen_213_part_00